MNDIVFEILKNNNWSPDRKIDTSLIEKYWDEKKYSVSNKQLEFIKKFGDLKIYFKGEDNHKHYNIEIFPTEFDLSLEDLNVYQKYFGTLLIPIGEIVCQNMILLMDDNIKIYAVFGEYVASLGNDFFNFIENLYYHKNLSGNIIKDF